MPFSPEKVIELTEAFDERTDKLRRIKGACVMEYRVTDGDKVREYLHHGVSRRFGILWYAITNVFQDFPVATTEKLDRDALMRVQINLQAFFINAIGVFDNFAWCYIYLHKLEGRIGGPQNVDMFKSKMQALLPPALKSYLTSAQTKNWYEDYFKAYRDALAHRIPLYIPPYTYTPDEKDRAEELQTRRNKAIEDHDFALVDALGIEREGLGSPSFFFAQSFTEKPPLILHPQMLVDAETVVEFGNLFLEHWREGPQPAE